MLPSGAVATSPSVPLGWTTGRPPHLDDAAELIGAGELPEVSVPLYETAPPRCQSQPLRAARAAGQHRSRSPPGGDRPHKVPGQVGRATSSVNSPIAWVLTVWLPLVPGLLMLRRWRARRGV
jgi:hypothetical protein